MLLHLAGLGASVTPLLLPARPTLDAWKQLAGVALSNGDAMHQAINIAQQKFANGQAYEETLQLVSYFLALQFQKPRDDAIAMLRANNPILAAHCSVEIEDMPPMRPTRHSSSATTGEQEADNNAIVEL
ncbi:hypothetical protein CSOJ01_15157 [Colletotrichum sojae]|uniref:Uncharacterized protein n=1 Tax=Colletotrichum sojae TaxID=2175907 RepID=A0A8H6IN22_9PEZI|nr:hypothetical protein CSOJ01_15157 [Colletotrichum sojae]